MPATKRKYKPGQIVASREESALVVHFEKEEMTVDEGTGEVLHSETTSGTKKIPIKGLSSTTDLGALAASIIAENKLIHPSKKGLVESLLAELLQHSLRMGFNDEDRKRLEKGLAREEKMMRIQLEAAQQASIHDLEEYIENLYEEKLDDRLRACAMVAQLFRSPGNLQTLLGHPSLVGALSRVLAEDYQKSIDLEIYIMSALFSISMWSDFHNLLTDNRVGELTLNVIKLELERAETREGESGIKPSLVAQKVSEYQMGLEDPRMSEKERRVLALAQKQDRLLYYSFYLLLNFSEDLSIERKIRKRGIIPLLVKSLERSNVDLLLVVVQFLKKLSIFAENKEEMMQAGVVDRLLRFVPVRNDELLSLVLRTLHNLSFDRRLRDKMVDGGLIAKAVDILPEPQFQAVVLGLLYHISMEDRYKSMFTFTNVIPLVRRYLLETERLRDCPELIALAVNLTQNLRNAEILCQDGYFQMLMERALRIQDDLLFKVLRNVSQVDNMAIKLMFKPYCENLVKMLQEGHVHANVLVEVLGILGNLNLPDFGFERLVEKYELIHFLAEALQPEVVEDDILLEIVVFLSVLCNEKTSPVIVQARLIPMLMDLITAKKQDDEFVLQITYLFLKLLAYPETAGELIQHTQAVSYLVDLCFDINQQVRLTATRSVDIIMEKDPDLAVEIRRIKFERFNAAFLEATAKSGPPAGGGGPRGPSGRGVTPTEYVQYAYDD